MIGSPVFLSVTNFNFEAPLMEALTSFVNNLATDFKAPIFLIFTLTDVKLAGDAAISNTPVVLSKTAVSFVRSIASSDPFKYTSKSLNFNLSATRLLVVIGIFTVTS